MIAGNTEHDASTAGRAARGPAGAPSSDDRQQSTIDQPIGARQWYMVFVLALVFLVSTLDRTIVSVMLEPIKREFGLSDQVMGLIVGFAFAGSYSLALLPMGMLINRVNRRNLLALVVLVWSLATALGSLAAGAISLLLCRLIVGASEAGAVPTGLSMIADSFPSRRRATAIGLYTMGAGVGGAVTGLLGGAVVHAYGWRAGFLVAALPGILLALVIMLTIREPRRGAMDPPSLAQSVGVQLSFRAVLRLALTDVPLICCYLGGGMMMLAMSATGSWLATFLVRMHGLNLRDAGILMAIVMAGGMGLGAAFGGPISDHLAKRHPAWRLGVCASLAGLCIPIGWLAVTSSSISVAVGLFVLWSFLAMAFQGPALATVLNRLPPLARGGGTAISQILSNLIGYGFGAYSVGLASDLIGGPQSLRYGLLIVQTAACALALLAFVIGVARFGNKDRFS